MPYLSKNYRHQGKSRRQNLREGGMFLGFSILSIMLTLFILGWAAYALQTEAADGIYQEINYQGKLNTSSGTQVSDGNWNFRFSLYEAETGGTAIWTERWTTTSTQVTTVNGVFSVSLGSITGFATSTVDFNTDNLWLQVHLDADADASGIWEEEFTTRKRLKSTPYAFNADTVDGIHATSTAAVASYLVSLDANGNLNLFDGGVSTTYATTTSLYVFSDGFVNSLNASTTANFENIFTFGSATTTGILEILQYASTTNLVLGNDGADLSDVSNVYVSSGSLFFDGTQITGASGFGISDWIFSGTDAITPTTSVGILVNASSTFAANLSVGNGALFVDSATKALGVGTTTPQYVLSISSTTDLSSVGLLQVATSTDQNIFTISGNGTFNFGVTDNTATSTIAHNLSIASGRDLQVENIYSYSPLNLRTDVIITGNATTTGWLNLGGTDGVSELMSTGSLYAVSATTTGHFEADATLYVKDSNVGIGTTTPANKLTVSDTLARIEVDATSSHAELWLDRQATNSTAVIEFRTDGTTNFEVGLDNDTSDLNWHIGNNAQSSKYLTVTTAGNIGIGDASPASLFTVGSGELFTIDSSGNASTTGYLNIGTGNGGLSLSSGDLFVSDSATTTGSLHITSGEINPDGTAVTFG